MRSSKEQMPIEEFLANPTAPILIDVRGSSNADPAIPGSKRVYLLDIEERTEAFEQRFAAQMAHRTLLLYCSKGEGSHFLVGKFSGKYRVQSLQGGMVSYLTTVSRLLHEHPYEDPKKRGDTMVKILAALTNRETDPDTFRKIVDRLLRCTPNPKFRKLVR
ncbi:MAG: rhodanese-like domain-containing protein [Magnetococcales bacterium]|nr:rhodanese-like domain-containing protein [Magnetococcales bacterium]MBF0584609.1 rhodanese-like domain-containing protein [Magnetococcales bacterium]